MYLCLFFYISICSYTFRYWLCVCVGDSYPIMSVPVAGNGHSAHREDAGWDLWSTAAVSPGVFSCFCGCSCFPQSSLISDYGSPRGCFPSRQQTLPSWQGCFKLAFHPNLHMFLECLHCASNPLGVTCSVRIQELTVHLERWGLRIWNPEDVRLCKFRFPDAVHSLSCPGSAGHLQKPTSGLRVRRSGVGAGCARWFRGRGSPDLAPAWPLTGCMWLCASEFVCLVVLGWEASVGPGVWSPQAAPGRQCASCQLFALPPLRSPHSCLSGFSSHCLSFLF